MIHVLAPKIWSVTTVDPGLLRQTIPDRPRDIMEVIVATGAGLSTVIVEARGTLLVLPEGCKTDQPFGDLFYVQTIYFMYLPVTGQVRKST